MTTEKSKLRVQEKLNKMGYSNEEAQKLIAKYWEETLWISSSNDKARYMSL
jgi:SOS response regulatory protein OraA/RecX